MTFFADLADLPENRRIEIIAAQVRAGLTVGFMVEDEDKAKRYLKKLTEKLKFTVIEQGELEDTYFVKIAPLGN